MGNVVYLRSANRSCSCGRTLACCKTQAKRDPGKQFFIATEACGECGRDTEVDMAQFVLKAKGVESGRCFVCCAPDRGSHQQVTFPAYGNIRREIPGLICVGCLDDALDEEAHALGLTLI